MLVRRVRDRLCRNKVPICIGTSATMANEGEDQTRAAAVAKVATRLFGVRVTPDAIIDESLERATDAAVKVSRQSLASAVDSEIPSSFGDDALRSHPLAIWIELQIGLRDGQRLSRRDPITIREAAARLAKDADRDETRCRLQLQNMLTLMSKPAVYWMVAVTLMGYTRQLRLKKMLRLRMLPKQWQLSPCKTISVCTTSYVV